MQAPGTTARALEVAVRRAADRLDDEAGHDVRVHVGVRAAVFDVALLILGHLPGDADRGATVRHAVRELLEGGRLVVAGQPLLDAVAVVGDVQRGPCAQCLGGGDAGVVVLPHLPGREVGVAAGAVPVALHGLRIEPGRDLILAGGREHLARPVEQPARDPELIADSRRRDRPDLELPLTRHDLGVDTRDLDAGLQAVLQVRLDNRASEHLVRADAAVVAALGGREAVVGPAERLDAVKEGVLLLQAEPGVVFGVLLGDLAAGRPGVGRVRLAVDEEDLAHHQLVRLASNRVIKDGDRLQHAVRTVAGRLLGARPVEAPDPGLLAERDDLRLRSQLGGRLRPVNPDVFGLVEVVLWHVAPSLLLLLVPCVLMPVRAYSKAEDIGRHSSRATYRVHKPWAAGPAGLFTTHQAPGGRRPPGPPRPAPSHPRRA